jgi:hypothetical protein
VQAGIASLSVLSTGVCHANHTPDQKIKTVLLQTLVVPSIPRFAISRRRYIKVSHSESCETGTSVTSRSVERARRVWITI